MAPSTLGTFLRAFTFGHVRQLDAVIAETIRRAWALGAGPGAGADDDRSGLDDLRGARQAQAGRRLRLHRRCSATTRCWPPGPTPARCCTPGCARDPPSGARKRFVEELDRPGPPGRRHRRVDGARRRRVLELRADRHARSVSGCAWSVTVRINPRSARRSTPSTRTAWTTIAYPDGGEAQVAETTYVTGRGRATRQRRVRLVVRRTRLTDPAQAAAVARLAAPRVHHQRRAADRRGRPVPPRPRHRRARHPRPQRRRRARALPVGPVLRQRRLARLRRARPQPHPLDRPPRRRPPRRTAHRRPHHPHPAARAARPARQPQPTMDPAAPRPMAMGHRPSTPRSTGSAHCRCSPEPPPRTGAAAHDHHALTTHRRKRHTTPTRSEQPPTLSPHAPLGLTGPTPRRPKPIGGSRLSACSTRSGNPSRLSPLYGRGGARRLRDHHIGVLHSSASWSAATGPVHLPRRRWGTEPLSLPADPRYSTTRTRERWNGEAWHG